MVWPTGAAACAVIVNKRMLNTRDKIVVVMVFPPQFWVWCCGGRTTWEVGIWDLGGE
jgi:hypothetical protein